MGIMKDNFYTSHFIWILIGPLLCLLALLTYIIISEEKEYKEVKAAYIIIIKWQEAQFNQNKQIIIWLQEIKDTLWEWEVEY